MHERKEVLLQLLSDSVEKISLPNTIFSFTNTITEESKNIPVKIIDFYEAANYLLD